MKLPGKKMIMMAAAVVMVVPVIFYYWASSGSLPKEKLSEINVFPWPSPDPPGEGEGDTFILVTYNTGYLSGMSNNLPVKVSQDVFENNMQALLRLMESIKPDIIGFQEIDFHSHRSYHVNQLQTIAGRAGYKYAAVAVSWDKHYVPFPYWPPPVHFGKMLSGQAVLSRRPILSAGRVALGKPLNKPFYYNAFSLDRLVQVVKIKIKETDIIILNVHLEAFDRETREKQAVKVLDLYRTYNKNYPVLLIGDFNCVPPDALQKKNFTDEPEADFTGDGTIGLFLAEKSLRAAAPMDFTFPSVSPTRKLDYIFYTHEKILCLESWTPTEITASDHLPVVMKFSLRRGQGVD